MSQSENSSRPSLSVGIINFNRAKYIARTIESVISQSYRPREFIILDDCSSDGSVEIIEEYIAREPWIRFIRNPENRGILHNLEVIIDEMTGDYLFTLGSDDLALPGLFEESMKLLEKYPQAGLCCYIMDQIDMEGQHLSYSLREDLDIPEFIPPEKLVPCLQQGWYINPPIYRRLAFYEAGRFLPECGFMSDWYASVRIALTHGVCYIPRPLLGWRISDTSFSVTNSRDPEKNLAVYSNMLHLLNDLKKSIHVSQEFFDYYRQLFVKRQNESIKSALYIHQEAFLEEMKRLKTKPSPLDRLLLEVVKGIMKVERFLALKYVGRDFYRRFDEKARFLKDI